MQTEKRIGPFQTLLVGLSIYVLAALLIERIAPLSVEMQRILQWADTAICVVFLADFFHRLARAEKRLRFLKWGWIDFISSIPTLDVLRWGRLVRVARVLRVLRGVRSVKIIFGFLFVSRAKGAVVSAVLACMLLLVFSSVAILHLENEPDSKITTAEDSVWWSLSTFTTVAFTDRLPATSEGRMLGVLLALAGMGLFAVLTACFASWFIEQEEEEEQELLRQLTGEVAALRDEIRLLREGSEASRQAGHTL